MTAEELRAILARGREQPGAEFKGPGSRKDRAFFAVVVRAMMGMANRRDGGVVILGVGETQTGLTPVGLSSEDLATWHYDHVADGVASYADPYLEFEIEPCTVDGADLLVIEVREFDEIPVICKRACGEKLSDGACYVRSRRKPETLPVASHVDMRELIELATTKALRKFLARAFEAGLQGQLSPEAADADQFNAQIRDLM